MERPVSVTRATQVLTALVLVSGVTAVLAVFLRDDLIRSWAEGHRTAREIVRQGGVEALEQSTINPPAFVPVAVVLFVVFAALAWVLIIFIRAGHEWARLTLAGSLVLMAIATGGGMRTSPPTIFVVMAWLSIALEAVLLYFLAHRDTTAYIRGTWEPDPEPERAAVEPA